MKFIFVFLVLITCYSCDINNQKLILINNSNEPIYYMLLTDTILSGDNYLYKVLPHDSVWPNFVRGGEGAWEYEINTKSNDSTLHIFIFLTDKISVKVIANANYKRIDLKVQDLDSTNWKVVYE